MKNGVIVETMMISRTEQNLHFQCGRGFRYPQVAPRHAAASSFFQGSHPQGQSPLKEWLVFEALGVLVGAFLSGVISDRLTFSLERPPHVKSWVRIAGAFLGGVLFGIGSQFGRGCTSGAALSGMAVLSAGGFVTMLAIFGSAYAVAYFFRKLWI
jgi:hypothetical protein